MTADIGGARRAGAPWHLWVVGIVSLLWNGFGCFDYTMINLQGDAYLRSMGMNEAQLAYFHDLPAWTTAAWAVGVWGGALGSLLLLLRRRWAVPAFAISFVAAVLSVVYALFLSEGGEAMAEHTPVQIVIIVVAAFLLWYSGWMSKRGVLR